MIGVLGVQKKIIQNQLESADSPSTSTLNTESPEQRARTSNIAHLVLGFPNRFQSIPLPISTHDQHNSIPDVDIGWYHLLCLRLHNYGPFNGWLVECALFCSVTATRAPSNHPKLSTPPTAMRTPVPTSQARVDSGRGAGIRPRRASDSDVRLGWMYASGAAGVSRDQEDQK